ncbi:hypothetical protein RDWZM_004194 [Blomia tropicalis]|uniref:Uncharacterized protein n=1 Tax=Blomia tropicalis TaxID=40697 RepID=A0A9Q0MHM4_BLOTA|nr:hypothetical protein RDWZM_004194 [Blomia tropicalis]
MFVSNLHHDISICLLVNVSNRRGPQILVQSDEKSNETPVDHSSTNIDKENIDLKDESLSKFVNLSDHSIKKIEMIEYGYFVANIETLFATFLIPVLRQI